MRKAALAVLMTGVLALMISCGGGGGGGGAASTPSAPREKASLTLKNLPRGAAVYVDGVKQTVKDNAVSVDAGERKVVIKKAGYVMDAEGGLIAVSLKPGESKEISVSMSSVAPPVLPGSIARTR